jgi:hypothetical protein
MKRYLVVANQTLGGEHLLQLLRDRAEASACALHVLVPASADPTEATHDEVQERLLANRRLEDALQRFGDLGTEVTGEVGDHRPADAIRDVLQRGEQFDEIILSTLPAGVSRWLRLDVVSQVDRAVDLPVTHVIAQDTPVSSG